jgi:hypothetical protein
MKCGHANLLVVCKQVAGHRWLEWKGKRKRLSHTNEEFAVIGIYMNFAAGAYVEDITSVRDC